MVASQVQEHAVFGGVIPELAAREHLKALGPLLDACLQEAGVSLSQIDAIAVTQGPGLIGPLLVGAAFARSLAVALNIPIIPVDHVHAHVFGAMVSENFELSELFPAMALVVSGGHTNLYRMGAITSFRLLGFSLDDACGECFDKVGKMLGLPYPGGPHIEKCARLGDDRAYPMPTLNVAKDELRFSFSGLKTHMLNTVRATKDLDSEKIANLCASFQRAAFSQIISRMAFEWNDFGNYKGLFIAGGVAANQTFRQMIQQAIPTQPIFPALKYCGDNAAMVASYGYFTVQSQKGSLLQKASYWEPYSTYRYEAVQ
jgi:N6-L-threonylcarbamoyladenine synthase